MSKKESSPPKKNLDEEEKLKGPKGALYLSQNLEKDVANLKKKFPEFEYEVLDVEKFLKGAAKSEEKSKK